MIALGPVITAYEYAMTEAEGRNTWRTDRYSPCPRRDAGTYLTFLAAIGYQLSAIEQAVADGTAWTGDTADDLLTAGSTEAEQDQPADDDGGEPPRGEADGGTDREVEQAA